MRYKDISEVKGYECYCMSKLQEFERYEGPDIKNAITKVTRNKILEMRNELL